MLGLIDIAIRNSIGRANREEEERKKKEREAEREEREWRRQQRIEEARWRAEEQRRKAEQARQEREARLRLEKEKALRFLSEHLGIQSLDEIASRVYPRQQIFLAALQKAIEHHRGDLDRWRTESSIWYSDYWTIDIPLRNPDEEHLLIRIMTYLKGDHADQFELVGNYSGEPLNPRLGPYEPPLEFRKTALKYFNQLFEEAGRNAPFTGRFLRIMKCYHENPEITAKQIAEMTGLSPSSIPTYKRDLLAEAREYLPEHADFSIPKGNNKHVHADVVPPYWWKQGLCFETE